MATDHARSNALRLGVRLEALTVAWMAVEATLAIGAGVVARSVLLTAFGADSLIELLSGATLLWRLSAEARGRNGTRVAAVESQAVWISAILLILLCAYVAATSVAGVVFRIAPERSWLGLAVAGVAVVTMPLLAAKKRAANRTIQSGALRADIAESITCAYLAAVTVVGVAINVITGWWWVEYVAAIALLRWLIPEAREALEAWRQGRSLGELD